MSDPSEAERFWRKYHPEAVEAVEYCLKRGMSASATAANENMALDDVLEIRSFLR